jgi:ribonuclease P/MRP protein subunit POP5
MKLKILPPTLRKNHRYLTLDIKSENIISKNDLMSAIWQTSLNSFGEIESSNFNMRIIHFYDLNKEKTNIFPNYNDSVRIDKNNEFFYYKVILRCQRGQEEKLRGALASLYRYKGTKIAISTINKSVTIKSAVNNLNQN